MKKVSRINKFIVTNFAYGTGPYLRTTELVLAINEELESQGRERFGIIAPWVYGEKQKRIMLEEFSAANQQYPGEILLCSRLGEILKTIFYGDNTYQQALEIWADKFNEVNSAATDYLKGEIEVEDLAGHKKVVSGGDIVLELSRSGRVKYGLSVCFGVSFGHISEILKNTLTISKEEIAVDRELVKRVIPLAEEIESQYQFIGLAHPGTFSYMANRQPYPKEVLIPPTIYPPVPNNDDIAEGIYVTITGIPGLERLYKEAEQLGLKIYSNDPKTVPGSEKLLPHVVSNPKIIFQFARSGWGSVWLSQLSGTPLVVPDFDPKDDPEIYFNNRCVEKLGLGIVYRGQGLGEMIAEAEKMKPAIRAFNQELLEKFGTLDGNRYAAKLIAEKLTSKA
ncbi:MAG: hypothetical protein AAB911_01415 [Patescibacteria group bacterium]